MESSEYREKLLIHAMKRGFNEPRIVENKWIFESASGAYAIVEFEPGLTEKKGYLLWAKIQLTAAANAVMDNPPPKRIRPSKAMMPDNQPPTQVWTESWVAEFGPHTANFDENSEAGKWLMFIAHAYVDDTWKNVSRAVREDGLAYFAKVSTAGGTPPGRPHVLCFYVRDWNNRQEAMALRERLRILGFKRKIHFKRDSMTLDGISGSEYSA